MKSKKLKLFYYIHVHIVEIPTNKGAQFTHLNLEKWGYQSNARDDVYCIIF